MDSGASFHTTGNRDVFDNYIAGDYGKVFLADGKPLEIVGMGDVRLKMSNGSFWKINKVRHVSRLTRNLILVGQLDDEGHKVTFGDGSWRVSKGAMIIARGTKTGTLYMTSSCRDILAAVDAGANSSLWLSRHGDTSEKGMKMLVSNGKLPKKVSFSKEVREPKSADLELVHTDVCEPSPVTSLGDHSRYYGTTVEDSSRKFWVYFLKNKSDVYETFKQWEFAMKDVMDSLSSNHMWELSELPEGKKVLHSKWEYCLEHDGSKRYKEILVVKVEKEVIDYTDIFSLVVKLTTIRTVLGLMVKEDLHLEQLDVKTVFLHGELDEKMNQSQGFELDGSYIMLLVYVDDMLITGVCLKEIDKLKIEFAMKDLCAAKQILGIEILIDRVNGVLKLEKIPGSKNPADMFTKGFIRDIGEILSVLLDDLKIALALLKGNMKLDLT
ncbi:uncharacterized protein [Henckelia pumila]|uniref:uncharacterized protein n=1 Tax=Henckelia pumila TaxID=405737 RepID=UPI003C6E2DC7